MRNSVLLKTYSYDFFSYQKENKTKPKKNSSYRSSRPFLIKMLIRIKTFNLDQPKFNHDWEKGRSSHLECDLAAFTVQGDNNMSLLSVTIFHEQILFN